jgi:hypothetical protein
MQFHNSPNRGEERGRKRVPVIEVSSCSFVSVAVHRVAKRFEAVQGPICGIISRTEAVQLGCDVR